MKELKERKSIRRFSKEDISDENLKKILEAGMSGPSCVNAQDWCFLVIKNKDTLKKMVEANGPAANPLLNANVGILVCGDLNKAYVNAKDYWIIDAAIACQNMILEATSLHIGSLWLGTYPEKERVNKQIALFDLPENIIPHSIIALGYPDDQEELHKGPRSHYDESKIHYEKYNNI